VENVAVTASDVGCKPITFRLAALFCFARFLSCEIDINSERSEGTLFIATVRA